MTDRELWINDAACYAQGQAASYALEATMELDRGCPELCVYYQAQAARWANLAQHWLGLLLESAPHANT